MAWQNVHLFPLISFIILPSTFITTYLISISRGDVEIGFPYISDTGNKVPESCIFSQFVNLSAAMYAFTIYIRYKQIEQYYRDHLSLESGRIIRVNYVTFVFGLISCGGLSVVANFQEKNLRVIHLTGAITCFAAGLVYCYCQTWMSFRMHPLVNTRRVAKVRLLLTTIMLCSFLTSLILGPLAISQFHGEDRSKWKVNDGGYYLHMIAAISEWITAFCLNFFLLSYTREMHKITVTSPRILITVDESLNVVNSSILDDENGLFQSDEQVEIIQPVKSRSQSYNNKQNTSQNGGMANSLIG